MINMLQLITNILLSHCYTYLSCIITMRYRLPGSFLNGSSTHTHGGTHAHKVIIIKIAQ